MNDTSSALLQYLDSQFLMVMATYGTEIGTANLYFLNDDELNIYFMSEKSTQHCQDIAQNPEVAIAISDTTRTPDLPKIGVQLKGKAEIVPAEKIETVLALWNDKFIALGGKPAEATKFAPESKTALYVVKPEVIKFYNTELFAEEKVQVVEPE